MELKSVVSVRRSHIQGWLELEISADLGEGVQVYPYTYFPGENVGLNPEITAWLMSNPDFQVGDALPPPAPPPEPTPAEKLAAAGLSVADLKALLGLA